MFVEASEVAQLPEDHLFAFDADATFGLSDGGPQLQRESSGSAWRQAKCIKFLAATPVAPVTLQAQVTGLITRFLTTAAVINSSFDASATYAVWQLAEQLRAEPEFMGAQVNVVFPTPSTRGPDGKLTFSTIKTPYITINPAGSNGTDAGELIVEPALHAVFALGPLATGVHAYAAPPGPSPLARKLVGLTQVWVGTHAQLALLVSELATAVALTFTQQGMGLPPWRTRNAFARRWERTAYTAAATDFTAAELGRLSVDGSGASDVADYEGDNDSDSSSSAASSVSDTDTDSMLLSADEESAQVSDRPTLEFAAPSKATSAQPIRVVHGFALAQDA